MYPHLSWCLFSFVNPVRNGTLNQKEASKIIFCWFLGAMARNERSPLISLGLLNTYCTGYPCIDIKSIYGPWRPYRIMIGIVSPKFITLYCITYVGPINETTSHHDQLPCHKSCCSSWTRTQENIDELNLLYRHLIHVKNARSGWNLVSKGHIYFFGIKLPTTSFN